MDEPQFDELSKALAGVSSRRGFFKVVAGAIGAAFGLGRVEAQTGPGGSDCGNNGASCTAQKCCEGLICSTDGTMSTEKFCCPEPTRPCNGVCLDLQNDPMNCSACGNECPERENATRVCVEGVCGYVCDPGYADCDLDPSTGCEINLLTDATNCSACGNQCPQRKNATRVCVEGHCGYVCNPGFADCDGNADNGCETELATSVDNCNACGNACPERANATRTCVAGQCGYVCNAGYADCDLDPSDGCEINLLTDLTNCGACGNQCPNRANATRTCVAGVCGYVCNTGYADCDAQAGNGCETNLLTDVLSCGACGQQCTAGPNQTATCVAGVCGAVCNLGYADCDPNAAGCETNLQTDVLNCGACGTRCAANQCQNPTCTLGVCGTTNKAMGTTCNDNNACTTNDVCNGLGGCTGTPIVGCTVCTADNQCPSGQTCSGGRCVCSNNRRACGDKCCPQNQNTCTINTQGQYTCS